MTADRDAAVVGHVEPLVGVGGPRIGPVQTGDPQRAAGGRPQAHGAVHMEPRVIPVGEVCQFTDRIDGARVHIPRLAADDGGPVSAVSEGLRQGGWTHRAVGVGRHGHECARAEPQQAGRARNRHVRFVAHDQPDGRRAGEAGSLDIPPGLREHVVPGRGEGGGVGHLAAGHECEGALRRQAKQVEQPLPGDLFDHGRRGSGGEEARVLVPGRHQPVGRECRGERPSDHEAEEPAHAHEPAGLHRVGQVVHHGKRIARVLWRWASERLPQGA